MKGIPLAAALMIVATTFAPAALPASADESGMVNAQVTVASPCILLDETSIDYGTAAFGTSAAEVHLTPPPSSWPTFTNCSSSGEYVGIRATSAVGSSGAAWALTGLIGNPCTVAPPGKNVYSVDAVGVNASGFIIAKGQSGSGGLKNQSKLFYAYPAGATAVLFASNQATRLLTDIWMPCAGSDGAGQTMTFSFTLTASF